MKPFRLQKRKGATKMRNRMKRGFTLVEILIVVVILGILAAIVIPQFSQASTDSKVSSLQSNLQTLRSQVALYKIQHNDVTPAAATFADQMTQFSDVAGNVNGTTKTAVFCFGPYLQVGVPNNPFTNANVIGVDWVYTTDGETWSLTAGDGGGLVTGDLWTKISAF
jgi:general secretion pathway protein G